MEVTALIMAGGRGERFWPKSRRNLPKQFLSLTGDGKTMLQLTVERILPLVPMTHIFIATGKDYRKLVCEQLPEIPEENILCEPVGRNTAPCIGLGAVHIEKKFGDAFMFVLASDHLIRCNDRFLGTMKEACQTAENGENLITIGIRPGYPETGYGYIKVKKPDADPSDGKPNVEGTTLRSHEPSCCISEKAYPVEHFVEKPDLTLAERYVESGDYLWNSGMFVWKVSSILKNMERFLPELYRGLKVIQKAVGTDLEQETLEREFPGFPSESIDYGIMEKAENIYTIPGDFGWDDVGSWLAVGRMKHADEAGNVTEGNVLTVDTRDCILQGGRKLIAAVGIRELVVVDTEDATLICSRDGTSQIKSVLELLRQRKQEQYL